MKGLSIKKAAQLNKPSNPFAFANRLPALQEFSVDEIEDIYQLSHLH